MPEAPRSAAEPDTPRQATAGRWLAIETAGLHGSIAAAEVTEAGWGPIEAVSLPTDARSARTLAPAIDALLKRLGWPPTSLSAVAVAIGPGSFTGLRVGLVTAKTLAYATGTAVLGVDTLDALAEVAAPPAVPESRLWTVLDAQRQELFAAAFRTENHGWHRDEPTQRITRPELAGRLGPADTVLGPIAESLDLEAPCVATVPTAEGVLRVAHRRWLQGATDSAFALTPQYHRLSAAEEKAAST